MTATARLVVGALAAVATMAVAAPVGAAPTAALDQCTTTRGTVVAVDFGHWGGPVVRGCGVQSGGQPDASGFVLLQDGGFTTAGTSRDGPAFICRLGNASFDGGRQYPTATQDACNVTPPESAYWSLWLAPPGATSWQHSDYGATSDHPVTGGVELWTFGGTNTAGTSGTGVPSNGLVNQLRAHHTTPAGGAPATTGGLATARRVSPAAVRPAGARLPARGVRRSARHRVRPRRPPPRPDRRPAPAPPATLRRSSRPGPRRRATTAAGRCCRS